MSRRRPALPAAEVYRQSTRVRDKLFSLAVRSSFAAFGPHTVVRLPVRLGGEDRIALGRGVHVGPGSWLQVIGHEPEAPGPVLRVGDGTSIAGACVLSAAVGLEVGRSVLMARNVYVADHAHAFEDGTRPVIEQGITDQHPVRIGDGAWLGQNVVVMPGVTIGRGAVVGANAVVLDDVPPRSVAVGVPARVVRTLD